MVTPAPVPSNVPRPQAASSSTSPTLPNSNNSSINNARVKEEPPYGNHGLPNGIQPNYGNSIAQQRAAQQLQQKFGQHATQQISQLQAQAALSNPGQPQQNPQNIQLPPQMGEAQRRAMELNQQRQAQQLQQQRLAQQQAQVRAQASTSQNDGASEWDEYVAQRRAAVLDNPGSFYNAELTLRQLAAEAGRSMEGGGLMLPLSEQPKCPQPKKHKAISSAVPSGMQDLVTAQTPPSGPRLQQLDGPGDLDDDVKPVKEEEDLGDEDDEDAINSDLDDPDDDNADEVGGDGADDAIILCTYDKVQRVKNKWKCILKDGVVSTGGKEYDPHPLTRICSEGD